MADAGAGIEHLGWYWQSGLTPGQKNWHWQCADCGAEGKGSNLELEAHFKACHVDNDFEAFAESATWAE